MSSILDSIKDAVKYIKNGMKGGKRKSKRRSMKGGSAYQHTIATYGGIGQQHAQTGSNVIATNAGVPTPSPEVKGGNRKSKRRSMKGGSAYQHTIATYGGIGQQHAQEGSNVIAANVGAPEPAPEPAPEMKGGNRKSKRRSMKGKKSSKK